MIHEKYLGALADLRSLAGEVPPEIWERMRPAVNQLAGVMEIVEALESTPICVIQAMALSRAQQPVKQ
ncbi:hypothetical protein [Desulfohalovibrio reitneri]|uniref:hypothetical protein n=1 Tax=Desulfohalovibrio reitneri TaxID=1307759 RepID=UPI0004A6D679|nr:hypothetical protein [Desulfohalovibrio reitneri]